MKTDKWVVTFEIKVEARTDSGAPRQEAISAAVRNIKMFRWDHHHADSCVTTVRKVVTAR